MKTFSFRNLFKTKYQIFKERAVYFRLNEKDRDLFLLSLDLEEYIFQHNHNWNKVKKAKYTSLLEEIQENL